VAIAEKTDWLWLLADALMDRAEVNLAAGEPRQAVNAVERALELYERKGIVPSAARASALLETLTTKADPQKSASFARLATLKLRHHPRKSLVGSSRVSSPSSELCQDQVTQERPAAPDAR